MKATKLLFWILTINLALAAQAQAQTFLSNGLVAYYPFIGNANDASDNGNNLTNYGATLCADRFGNSNQAYSFNGTNYLGTATPPLTETTNWTLTAWIEPATLSQTAAYAVLLGHENGVTGNGYGFGISGGTLSSAGNQLFGVLSGVNFFPTGYVFPATNQWYQIVMLRNSGVTMLYVNGVAATNASAYTPIAPTALEIGTAGGARFFDGAVDDVRIYNRALSSNEVQQLYQFESAPSSYQANGQASAIAQVVNGFVVGVTVTFGSSGYTNTPTVTLIGGGGSGAQAQAVVSNGVVVAVNVLAPGSGYTNPPTVIIAAPFPYAATAGAQVVNGYVVGLNLAESGSGYTNTPNVRIIGGGGSGAEAAAVVSNGVVIAINLLVVGSGYTNTPVVVIDPPFVPNPVLSIGPVSFLFFSNLATNSGYQLQQFTGWYWSNMTANFTATNSVFSPMVPGLASGRGFRLALSPVPAQAFAVPIMVNEFVVGATVTNGGSGYLTNPPVSIVGGGGSGAAGYCQISGGVLTNITMTNAGFGYTNPPTIEIGQPPASAVSPKVLLGMQLNSANLAPYDNYQIQFTPALGTPWGNWPGGLFTPTDVTSSQYLLVTNAAGFFRLLSVP